ncbi:MAG TPA: EF-P lysine aminoacylase EpmA [Pirellulales bacterium]
MNDDYRPSAPLENLRLRAKLLAKVREFFMTRGFLEVETPILSADTAVDRHLDPISVVLADDPRQPARGRTMFLQTSPEFGMKRLLAAGATAIFQITRAFRNAERGMLHNPEFTIVEWYRVGDELADAMTMISNLSQTLLATRPAERISYAAAFEKHAGLNPHQATSAELVSAIQRFKIALPSGLSDDRDGLLNLILAECVEPRLGQAAPTILHGYPASQAALAKISDTSPAVALRFELYVRGIELANGYQELLDADELRRRNAKANVARAADGKPKLPEESRLLAAMEAGMPLCTGVALGFDRVAMLAAEANSLADVMAFPIDRA